MIRKRLSVLIIAGTILLTGCSGFGPGRHGEGWELPDNPCSISSVDDKDYGMVMYEVNGRMYSPYGTLDGKITGDDLRDCYGYVDDDKSTRIYSLYADPYDNYLMLCNVNGIMEQPMFLRANDTYRKDVFTPEYIGSLGYEYWGSSGSHSEMGVARISMICNAEDVVLIDYGIVINGKDGGGGETGYVSGDAVDKGDLFDIEITELNLEGKADHDQPFSVAVTFTVTDTDGQVHEVEGVYEREMMLGAKLTGLEIRYDDGVYYLFEDV